MAQLSYPSSMPVPQLSVVMPCYNENAQIETLLKEWSRTFEDKAISYEFIVINDGSLDGTSRVLDRLRQEIKNLRIVHQLNSGHGKAVRRGYELSRGDYVLQLDSSGRFDPTDFELFWQEKDRYELIVANRTHRLDSFLRRLCIRLVTSSIESLFKIQILDPDVSFRLFKRSSVLRALEKIPVAFQGVNLAMTVMMKLQDKAQVLDVKIPYRLRALHKGRPSTWETLRLLQKELSQLFQIKFLLKSPA